MYKKPLDITKMSKRGRLALKKITQPDGTMTYKTFREEEIDEKDNCLKTVFENGEIIYTTTFDDIKRLIKAQ